MKTIQNKIQQLCKKPHKYFYFISPGIFKRMCTLCIASADVRMCTLSRSSKTLFRFFADINSWVICALGLVKHNVKHLNCSFFQFHLSHSWSFHHLIHKWTKSFAVYCTVWTSCSDISSLFYVSMQHTLNKSIYNLTEQISSQFQKKLLWRFMISFHDIFYI